MEAAWRPTGSSPGGERTGEPGLTTTGVVDVHEGVGGDGDLLLGRRGGQLLVEDGAGVGGAHGGLGGAAGEAGGAGQVLLGAARARHALVAAGLGVGAVLAGYGGAAGTVGTPPGRGSMGSRASWYVEWWRCRRSLRANDSWQALHL